MEDNICRDELGFDVDSYIKYEKEDIYYEVKDRLVELIKISKNNSHLPELTIDALAHSEAQKLIKIMEKK